MTPAERVDAIFAVYHQYGDRHYGESVTELEHALQSASVARSKNEPAAMVAAALLHDFGHLLHHAGEDVAERGIDMRHETLGADRLTAWFGPDVTEPIRLHVEAKRYLCAKDPQYFEGLSSASRRSLELQGGPMTESEVRAFEANPHHQTAIRLREYDDTGKRDDLAVVGLEDFRGVVESVVRG